MTIRRVIRSERTQKRDRRSNARRYESLDTLRGEMSPELIEDLKRAYDAGSSRAGTLIGKHLREITGILRKYGVDMYDTTVSLGDFRGAYDTLARDILLSADIITLEDVYGEGRRVRVHDRARRYEENYLDDDFPFQDLALDIPDALEFHLEEMRYAAQVAHAVEPEVYGYLVRLFSEVDKACRLSISNHRGQLVTACRVVLDIAQTINRQMDGGSMQAVWKKFLGRDFQSCRSGMMRFAQKVADLMYDLKN